MTMRKKVGEGVKAQRLKQRLITALEADQTFQRMFKGKRISNGEFSASEGHWRKKTPTVTYGKSPSGSKEVTSPSQSAHGKA